MTSQQTYELTLTCGDTISCGSHAETGAYRMCIHCDSRKRVTRSVFVQPIVTDSDGKSWADALTTAERSVMYGLISKGWDNTYKLWGAVNRYGGHETSALRDMCHDLTDLLTDLNVAGV